MRIRQVPPSVVIDALIVATKAGLTLTTTEIETHYLAGGNVPSVIKALISADKANILLSFKQATAIDLAGRDVFEAVQISVNPKVINTPSVSTCGHGWHSTHCTGTGHRFEPTFSSWSEVRVKKPFWLGWEREL
jgi:uncharacterized protein YqfA (UPF0365 family)